MGVLVDQNTTFVIQGITGREAVNMTRECLDYGSKIVGGVTPGRMGRDVYGVPVYDTVKQITTKTKVDVSIVVVPPAFARDAVLEAIDAGIKLVIVVTERIPRAEVGQFLEYAELKGTRIIGPNCLGMIVPGKVKIGGIGGPAADAKNAFKPGLVGIMSRSGGMTTEIANTLSASGLGVSTAISMGGDPLIGSTYAEIFPLFEKDEQTKAVVIYSEPGGPYEAQLSKHIQAHKSRLPIVAFMAGRFMDSMPGMRFGHAGTIVEGKADTSAEKIVRLREAGIKVAETIPDIPKLVREALNERGVKV